MNHLRRAINLFGLSEFREFIREELPDPKPPRKWFTNQMAKLRRSQPDISPLERSKKVKAMWYALPSHEQKQLSKEPALLEKRKGQRYRPQFDQQQIRQLKDKLNSITDYGEKDEDDLMPEEWEEIEEIKNAIREHERNIKTKGEDFF